MFSIKFPRRFRDRVDQFSFGLGQQWVPDIEYQDDAEFVAQVPCLVFDGIPGAGIPGAGHRLI